MIVFLLSVPQHAPEVLAEEQRMLKLARAGRGVATPLNPGWQIKRDWLNEDQQRAVHHVLTSEDKVLMINDSKIEGFNDIPRVVVLNAEKELNFKIDRDGRQIDLLVTPKMRERTDQFGRTLPVAMVGIVNNSTQADVRVKDYSIGAAIADGADRPWFIVEGTATFVRDLFKGIQTN